MLLLTILTATVYFSPTARASAARLSTTARDQLGILMRTRRSAVLRAAEAAVVPSAAGAPAAQVSAVCRTSRRMA